jgi:membrane protein DedA with SNARE-associated domain
VIAAAGWALGASYEKFNHAFRYLEYAVVLAIAAGVVYLLIRARRKDTIPR